MFPGKQRHTGVTYTLYHRLCPVCVPDAAVTTTLLQLPLLQLVAGVHMRIKNSLNGHQPFD